MQRHLLALTIACCIAGTGHAADEALATATPPAAEVPALLQHEAPALLQQLADSAPDADPAVIGHALGAMQCATANGMAPSQRLAVIDYSRPSSQPRLWVFDLEQQRLLFRELVAHGRNTGELMAERFSNEVDSRTTSLGLFRTRDTYNGSNGYSLRMDGLEPGVNDRALDRAIVMHGAPYVNEAHVKKFGRLGRSWGCPAVREGVARQIIDTLKGGQFIFSWYPDQQWVSSSRFLNCTQKTASL